MSDPRSVRVYFAWLDASQRFDYFVTGVSVAMVGYLASTVKADPYSVSSTLEVLALILILASAYVGLRRIEATLVAMQLDGKRLASGEAAGALKYIHRTGGRSLRTSTGEIIEANEAGRRANEQTAFSADVERLEQQWMDRAAGRYRWRNLLLLSGILVLVSARVVHAYGW
jgi:hypothetical protein